MSSSPDHDSHPAALRGEAQDLYVEFLVARNRAVGAIASELSSALAGAEQIRTAAREEASRRVQFGLDESRKVVELASFCAAMGSYSVLLCRAANVGAESRLPTRPWRDESAAGPTESIVPREIFVGVVSRPLFPPGHGLTLLPPVPALVSLAHSRHLLISSAPTQLDSAANLLRSAVLRLVLGSTPGSLRLTLLDLFGAGAGLAMLTDGLPPELRGPKVFARIEEVEAELRRLNAHVESVLQTRLGARYDSLDAYNEANPATAVPGQLVAILDLPAGGWTERSWELLVPILRNGPRAGVHLLATLDSSAPVPRGVDLEQLTDRATRITIDKEGLGHLDDPDFRDWPFVPDEPPDPATMERLLTEYGRAHAEGSRSLAAERILVPADWSGDSRLGLEVVIGFDDAGRAAALGLGDDPAHGLIGGMTGMGKSNLLHVLVAQLCSRYSPDELQLDLLDFREGVGFAPYRQLPHAHAVALETEREFALSVLRDLQAEIARRGKLFAAAGVDQFPAYRAKGERLARRVLLVDEFQVLLAEDDQLARDAAAVLEDLAKRGRGFGIHLLLSSQSPSVAGPYLSRIYNQMGLRLALRCRPADALAILGEGNDAAARLEEPGEAIVNAELGQVAGNCHVRVALLTREQLTERLAAIAVLGAGRYPRPVTFEGQAPADLAANPRLLALRAGTWSPEPGTAEAFLGEPIELKGPTSARFERYPRANLLVAGPEESDAYGLLAASLISLALQQPTARFDVVELARPSSPVASVLPNLAGRLGERLRSVSSREGPALLADLGADLDARRAGGAVDDTPRYLVVTGLHRWRELRGPDAYSQTDEAKVLLRLLDEGPELGIHVIAWSDGTAALERTLGRSAKGSFDLRAVLRLPEQDAQALLESSAAARLADNRALFRNEDWPLGRTEKFKPYPVPTADAVDALVGEG